MLFRGEYMKKKRLITLLISITTLLLFLNISLSFYFYHLAIKRGPKDFLQNNTDLEVSAEAMDVFLAGDWRNWTSEQNFETWKMTSFDGLQLQGYFLKAKEPTNKTVVFAHGYLGQAQDMGLFGEYYYEELGYNIFTPDLRGHGKSEGDYIGFGWHDRLDLIDWMKEIIENEGAETEIVMHGLSMGAAAVLMASGEELPKNVKAIVADSPYTSVYDLFAYQMKRMYHLPAFPFLPITSVVTNLKAGYTLGEASALQQVEKASVPILYIHGEKDTFVPTEMTNQLCEHTKSDCQLWTIADASHGEGFVLEKEKYKSILKKFLNKNIG